ncbi:MAG: hypothetical protein ACRDJY_08895 [Thermoleophilaceae bacterium]
MRLALLLVVAIATTCVSTASAADKARTTVTLSSVTLGGGQTNWGGPISSPKKGCKNNRRVLVFRVQQGKDAKVGATKSYKGIVAKGYFWSYSEQGAAPSGKYYAKVKPTDTCQGDRSKTVQGPS